MVRLSVTLALPLLALSLLPGCGPKTFIVPKGKHHLVTLSSLRAQEKRIERLLKSGKRVLIALKKGDRIPVSLVLDTSVASLKSRDYLLVKRDLCILVGLKRVAFSPDCRRFASMRRGKSVWRLFKMGRGSTSVGLKVTKAGLEMPIVVRTK